MSYSISFKALGAGDEAREMAKPRSLDDILLVSKPSVRAMRLVRLHSIRPDVIGICKHKMPRPSDIERSLCIFPSLPRRLQRRNSSGVAELGLVPRRRRESRPPTRRRECS